MQSRAESQPAAFAPEGNPSIAAPRVSLAQTLIGALALLSGVLATNGVGGSGTTWLAVIVALVLSQIAWAVIWYGLAEVPWRDPLSHWRAWLGDTSNSNSQPRPAMPTLPYTQPGSAAAKMSIVGGHLQAWASAYFWPRYGAILLGLLGAVLVGLVLALVLGPWPTLLTIGVIVLAQIALLSNRAGSPPAGQPASPPLPLLTGLMWVSAPMMLGASLFGSLAWDVIWAALGLGVAYAGVSGRPTKASRAHWLIGGGLVLALLVITRRPLGAFAVALLMLPQVLLQPSRHIRWWFVGVMLALALALS